MPLYTASGALNVVVNDTSVTRGLYTTSGAIRVTIVPGTTYTGLYAPDGSLNVAIDSLNMGRYHPCGALRGVTQNSLVTYTGLYSPTGATYMYGLSEAISGAETLIQDEWNGFSLDFIDNSYSIHLSTNAETLLGTTISTADIGLGLDFIDNTRAMGIIEGMEFALNSADSLLFTNYYTAGTGLGLDFTTDSYSTRV